MEDWNAVHSEGSEGAIPVNRGQLRGLVILLGLIATVCLAFVAFLWVRGGQEPRVTVDYLAVFNARLEGVPNEDRAWELFLRAVERLPSGADEKALKELIENAGADDPRWEACGRAVEQLGEALDLIRAFSGKPALGLVAVAGIPLDYMISKGSYEKLLPPPPGQEGWMLHLHLPHLGEFRHMARLLRIDALHASAGGEATRAAADLEAIIGLARLSRDDGLIIGYIIAADLGVIASDTARELVNLYPGALDDEALARIDRTLADGIAEGSTRPDFLGERLHWKDFAQRIFTDDGRGDGSITLLGVQMMESWSPRSKEWILPKSRLGIGLATLLSTGRREVLREAEAFYEALAAYAVQPAWNRGSLPPIIDRYSGNHPPDSRRDLGLLLLHFMMPGISRVAYGWDKSLHDMEAARAVIAMERFRLANGRWPGSLDELVPEYLDTVPLDRFDGAPLRYRLAEGFPILYSIGVDRSDDGGRHATQADQWATVEQAGSFVRERLSEREGDWVYFPVQPAPIGP